MKNCPYCAEEIQDAAIKCKHCGEFLNQPERTPAEPTASKWYFNTSTMVVAFLCIGPFALPLVWLNPRLNLTRKIIWTTIIIVLTWLLTLATMEALRTLEEAYSDLMHGM